MSLAPASQHREHRATRKHANRRSGFGNIDRSDGIDVEPTGQERSREGVVDRVRHGVESRSIANDVDHAHIKNGVQVNVTADHKRVIGEIEEVELGPDPVFAVAREVRVVVGVGFFAACDCRRSCCPRGDAVSYPPLSLPAPPYVWIAVGPCL